MTASQDSIPTTIEEVANLVRSLDGNRQLSLSTLGPEGTSADFACRCLVPLLGESVSLEIDFAKNFDAVMEAALTGRSDLALIPSAYRDSTAFHWHPELKMIGCFVSNTPKYGLAIEDSALGEGEIVLAAMPEVQDLFFQLAPEDAKRRLGKVIEASSTSHAARLVSEGKATMAVCNELGVEQNHLRWFQQREGVPMVWMLFAHR